MTTVILTTKGAATWTVPGNVPAGSAINIDAWGAGSGGSGRNAGGTNFGAGGAAGSYANTPTYIVTPNDVLNGIPYVIGAGSGGGVGANPSAGGNTTWSNNNLNAIKNSTHTQAVAGTPGTLPADWSLLNLGGLSSSVVGFGTSPTGYAYIDYRFFGTSTGSSLIIAAAATPVTVATWAVSLQAAVVAGSQTNISGMTLAVDAFTSGGAYISTPIASSITLTSTITSFSASAAMPATTTNTNCYLNFTVAAGAVDITIRMSAFQFEAGASATAWKSTPCYTAATGGPAPIGTAGGVASVASNVTGFAGFQNIGGNGAAFNASGSGGGGAGAPEGAGSAGTTLGVGGNSASGATGGPVKTTTPGNPGGSAQDGGAGGGGLKTVAGVGGLGGSPGGGGGGSAVAGTSTGGAGGDGQIVLTFVQTPPFRRSNPQQDSIVAAWQPGPPQPQAAAKFNPTIISPIVAGQVARLDQINTLVAAWQPTAQTLPQAAPKLVFPANTTTWNPFQKDSTITLSNGNLTATKVANNLANGIVCSTPATTSGRYYFESVHTLATAANTAIGIGNTSSTVQGIYLGENADTIGYWGDGTVYNAGVLITTLATYGTGDNVGVAVDLINNKIWFRVNGGNWNNSAANHPESPSVGGITIPAGVFAQPVVNAANLFQASPSDVVLAKFAAADWIYQSPFAATPQPLLTPSNTVLAAWQAPSAPLPQVSPKLVSFSSSNPPFGLPNVQTNPALAVPPWVPLPQVSPKVTASGIVNNPPFGLPNAQTNPALDVPPWLPLPPTSPKLVPGTVAPIVPDNPPFALPNPQTYDVLGAWNLPIPPNPQVSPKFISESPGQNPPFVRQNPQHNVVLAAWAPQPPPAQAARPGTPPPAAVVNNPPRGVPNPQINSILALWTQPAAPLPQRAPNFTGSYIISDPSFGRFNQQNNPALDVPAWVPLPQTAPKYTASGAVDNPPFGVPNKQTIPLVWWRAPDPQPQRGAASVFPTVNEPPRGVPNKQNDAIIAQWEAKPNQVPQRSPKFISQTAPNNPPFRRVDPQIISAVTLWAQPIPPTPQAAPKLVPPAAVINNPPFGLKLSRAALGILASWVPPPPAPTQLFRGRPVSGPLPPAPVIPTSTPGPSDGLSDQDAETQRQKWLEWSARRRYRRPTEQAPAAEPALPAAPTIIPVLTPEHMAAILRANLAAVQQHNEQAARDAYHKAALTQMIHHKIAEDDEEAIAHLLRDL